MAIGGTPPLHVIPLFLLLLFGSVAAQGSDNAPGPVQGGETLSFGVVPQQAPSKLARLWTPILAEVSKRTGKRLVFRTAPSIPEFERRLARGEYDLAYMNPYHFTVFNRAPAYVALARQKGKRIRGIIVVRRDSPIRGLEDLRDATLAFPAPAAFAASVLPRAQLRESGIDITARYVSSHDSVYRGVAKGLMPAGGGIERTFNNVSEDVRKQLRVLWRTRDYTPHAIAAHPRLSMDSRKAITDALTSLGNDPEGQALLSTIGFSGIEPARDEDWDDVRALGIELLDRLVNDR